MYHYYLHWTIILLLSNIVSFVISSLRGKVSNIGLENHFQRRKTLNSSTRYSENVVIHRSLLADSLDESSFPSIAVSSSPSFPPHTPVIVSSNASWTYYISYPKCCKDQPNYDPKAPTEECTQYNGCAYPGIFHAIGTRSVSFVES
jgi:hypothetical protein